MRRPTQVRLISDLKANAREVPSDIAGSSQPVIITQNGEAKAVLDVASLEQSQETLALLKLLALEQGDGEAGHTRSARFVIDRPRKSASRMPQ